MRRRDFLKAAFTAAALTASSPSALLAAARKTPQVDGTVPAAGSDSEFVDSHLHYLDFLQGTDGLEALTKAMDKACVGRAVLFGMPMIKQWDPSAPQKPKYYMSNDSRCYYAGAFCLLCAASMPTT